MGILSVCCWTLFSIFPKIIDIFCHCSKWSGDDIKAWGTIFTCFEHSQRLTVEPWMTSPKTDMNDIMSPLAFVPEALLAFLGWFGLGDDCSDGRAWMYAPTLLPWPMPMFSPAIQPDESVHVICRAGQLYSTAYHHFYEWTHKNSPPWIFSWIYANIMVSFMVALYLHILTFHGHRTGSYYGTYLWKPISTSLYCYKSWGGACQQLERCVDNIPSHFSKI